jgi:integrase
MTLDLDSPTAEVATPAKKKRKARRSFGGVTKRPNGTFQVTYWHPATRKQYSKTYPPGTKLTTIDLYLAQVRSDIATGKWVDPDITAAESAGCPTFEEYAETWLAAGVRHKDIAPRTEAKYRGLLDRHLIPEFGKMPLDAIKYADVYEWFKTLRSTRASTAAGAYRLMSTIYNSAISLEVITGASPCRVKHASKDPAKERSIVEDPATLQRAIDAIPPIHDRFKAGIMLGAMLQMRRGEVLGLQRGDIDLTTGLVTIQRAWSLDDKGKLSISGPKSDARKVPYYLPPNLIPAVQAHLDAYVGPEKTAWLFPGRNGLPAHPRTFLRTWKEAAASIGHPELTVHDLKHSGITWVRREGATNAEANRRGGHTSDAAGTRYSHGTLERDKVLADRLGKAWEDAAASSPQS